MKRYFEAAIKNIYAHGDTDIFPFPFENLALSDKSEAVVGLLEAAYPDVDAAIAQNTPHDLRALIPVGTTGFRVAAQLDPLWNALYLGSVLSIAEVIERARLADDQVFSYRLNPETYLEGDLFRRDIGWPEFVRASSDASDDAEFVITCDVADCYGRISHHKLENALQLLDVPKPTRSVIMEYLSNNTSTRSSGLPVGGPASRILAELALVNPDAYLRGEGIRFLRFADDFHIFCASKQEAYRALLTVSLALENEGLTLQKSKTRILSRAEFKSANSVLLKGDDEPRTPIDRLMSLTLRYDPYDANAAANYEALRAALEGIDIVSLLNEQIAQSRIHIPTTKKIVAALNLIADEAKFGAVLSMLDNMSSLFPICSNVFITIASIVDGLGGGERAEISKRLRSLHESGHEVMQVPNNVAYAVRILAKDKSAANQDFLHRCYEREDSILVRRDIGVVFANWPNFPWLSVFTKRFSTLNEWERRVAMEPVLRALNLGYERFSRPLNPTTFAYRRDIISETGFRLFGLSLGHGIDLEDSVGEAYLLACEYLDREPSELTPDEASEAIEMCRRLGEYARGIGGPVEFMPTFAGHGMMSSCFGDLVVGERLVEVKYVNRSFRSTDLRQLLCYCGLRYFNDGETFEEVALVNPLRGVAASIGLRELIDGASGRVPPEFFSELSYVLASGEVSR
jgi:hypothetical protein